MYLTKLEPFRPPKSDGDINETGWQPLAVLRETETLSYVTCKYKRYMKNTCTDYTELAHWMFTENLVREVVGEKVTYFLDPLRYKPSRYSGIQVRT